ncbi:hypothetical protein RND71_028582 [Anisodus tanguticus]|uniref:Uncharacterized protein n=1 Tax=Anisodus tanguticus TaxID=243964 RepID=A0AAE1V9B3_9SOLA|nr:hypothetical protein RND71_028582 [Anisodus tanguticus]
MENSLMKSDSPESNILRRISKGLEDWRQTQPTSEGSTAVRPSPADITLIWREVASGPSKSRVYGLGVLRSSLRPSPLLSNAFTSQNMKEMEAM